MLKLHQLKWLVVVAITGVAITGCSSPPAQPSYKDIPATGDPAHGKVVFESQINGAPACNSCHSLEISNNVGPGLAGFADRAATRVDGMGAREFLYESIVLPNKHLVPGFSNLMYTQYGEKLTKQDIADLMALLLGPASK
jgi:hypothetical protein